MIVVAAIPGIVAVLLALWRKQPLRAALAIGFIVTLVALVVLIGLSWNVTTIGYEFAP